MKSIKDIQRLLCKAEERQDQLMEIIRLQESEEGKGNANVDLYRRFNALFYAYEKAYEILEKGIQGKFS